MVYTQNIQMFDAQITRLFNALNTENTHSYAIKLYSDYLWNSMSLFIHKLHAQLDV